MTRKSLPALAGAAAIVALSIGGSPAPAAAAGVEAGVLTCNVASGWGFIFGSSRDVHCVYTPGPGVTEYYVGSISKFGVDIGYTQNAVIVWSVLAPTTSLAPGALAGGYGGVTGGATVGVGGDANLLIGGFNHSISLQPLSIEGNKGLNVAAGIAEINLHYERRQPPA
jgi:hypothetical protein